MHYFFPIFIGILFIGCSIKETPSPTPVQPDIPKEREIEIESILTKKTTLTDSNLAKTISFFAELSRQTDGVQSQSSFERIKRLNNLINQNFKYEKDVKTYGVNDYWASYYEMMQSGFKGDCEDFTFSKIQLSELFDIKKEDIFIGYTASGKHIFPIFFDGKQYLVSDTNGGLRRFDFYWKKHADLVVYNYDDLYTTKDSVLKVRKDNKILQKMLGVAEPIEKTP